MRDHIFDANELAIGDIVVFMCHKPWFFNGISDDGKYFYITDNSDNINDPRMRNVPLTEKEKGYKYPVSEFKDLVYYYASPELNDYREFKNSTCNHIETESMYHCATYQPGDKLFVRSNVTKDNLIFITDDDGIYYLKDFFVDTDSEMNKHMYVHIIKKDSASNTEKVFTISSDDLIKWCRNLTDRERETKGEKL